MVFSNKIFRTILLLCVFVIIVSSCSSGSNGKALNSDERIHDNDGVYSIPAENYSSLYIEILGGSEIPFYKANGEMTENGEKPVYNISIYDKENTLANENMPVLGNLKIKGNNSYINYYRSFKITLEGDEEYQGQEKFLLYKYPEDSIKVSMKLGMDLFSLFDDVASTKTEFIRLYLKDESTKNNDYVDYGLYILSENTSKNYLKTHGLDKNGELYEIKNFNFSYEEYINSSEIKKKDMLEYKNGTNPQKFENMLKEINDKENFEENFDKYFNIDNYLTWIGGNCLLGNYKASTKDFLLYSPSDSEKWYFFPMPTDNILLEESDRKKTTPPEEFAGLGWFTENIVHHQFLSDFDNQKLLYKKTQELLNTLDEDSIDKIVLGYKNILADFLIEGPDANYQKISIKEIEERLSRTKEKLSDNYTLLKGNLDKPLPFVIYDPEFSKEDKSYTIKWQEAISSSDVKYSVKISKDIDCNEVLFEQVTSETQVVVNERLRGNLYIFITAENNSGIQLANSYEKGLTSVVWGVRIYTFTGKGEK